MPRHLNEGSEFIPMSGATLDMSNGNLALPSGTAPPAVESRLISDALTTLESEVKFLPSSGILIVASGTQWMGIEFNA